MIRDDKLSTCHHNSYLCKGSVVVEIYGKYLTICLSFLLLGALHIMIANGTASDVVVMYSMSEIQEQVQ